ncbi:transglycosylase SLT domain-containing protein [Glaciimonas sp. PCH181]|uniref:transglycosylase SLT domain-containing protein n=1 Tax=Glaciimonas sp. PCH181 TaxID=2133943 RepID=UPI001CED85BE|nr:transglycosylase SLT domain-containing protein [Glaciimonas sp. PCH181]
MLARSIKVGTTRVRVGPSQTPLEALKQIGNQSAHATSNALLAVRGTLGDFISNSSNAGMVVLIVSLISIMGATALTVKPELAVQIKGLPIFGHQDANGNTASAAPNAIASREAVDTVDMEARKANNLTAMAEAINKSTQLHTDKAGLKTVRVADAHQQQWVTNWLSKRYRVAGDATNMFVSTAYKTAKETKLDPLLILAVMAIESGFNPFAESPVGAQGLMQVMSKIHQEKFENFGGVKAALNPAANIKVGSQILKDYVTQGGSIEAGLKRYVGAAAFATDGGYGNRVLAEYRRLQDVATGKNVPSGGSMAPIAVPKQRQTPVATQAPVIPSDAIVPAEAAIGMKDQPLQQSASVDQLSII